MANTVAGTLLTGIHASRPASGVTAGTLYACSTHGLVYQTSDTGSTWTTWSTWQPMTTAGDLPYGGAAGLPTRLAIGAAGGALSVVNSAIAWNSGTSFPSAVTGDRYWRTDRGLEYYYDGTRWLTVNEYVQPLGLLDALMPFGSSPGNDLWAPTDLGANGQWITRLVATVVTGATNTGSAYWSFQLTSLTSAAVAHNIGGTFDTSADSASTRPKHVVTIGAQVTAGDTHFVLVQTKTGAPSNIYVLADAIYRLVG